MEHRIRLLSEAADKDLALEIFELFAPKIILNYPFARTWFAEKVLPELATCRRWVWIVEAEEDPVGIAILKFNPLQKTAAKVSTLFVRDDWRCRGVGTALLRKILSWQHLGYHQEISIRCPLDIAPVLWPLLRKFSFMREKSPRVISGSSKLEMSYKRTPKYKGALSSR